MTSPFDVLMKSPRLQITFVSIVIFVLIAGTILSLIGTTSTTVHTGLSETATTTANQADEATNQLIADYNVNKYLVEPEDVPEPAYWEDMREIEEYYTPHAW
ncbi:hypothetical protein Metho_2485 (plasmid) [Methanomethylovorans hollandica DSM 15978]|jgi:uracil-DNA glycosylase|uniref:Methyl-accepting chemotaxis protein n=1 Tax=Methanomethylovorans hollandica (strain DSM 15978 / NBRC 107637 / DMS1) TaxID=867904 RepID=L0L0Z6_METHD|nr:hypothetical protein [Methanomethylovorans hollandica]AGB50625.1 hypothetical protein Metho_2485 [Methanomethylovorans hollandica DSM 15978]